MSSVTPQSILFSHQGIMRFSQIPVLCIKSIYKKLLICANNTENRSSSNTDRVFVQIYTVCPRACRWIPWCDYSTGFWDTGCKQITRADCDVHCVKKPLLH